MAKRRKRGGPKYLCPSHVGLIRQHYTMPMTATTRRAYMECMAIMLGMEKHLGKPISKLKLAQDRMMCEAFTKFRRDKIKKLRSMGVDYKPMIEEYWKSYYKPRAARLPAKIEKQKVLSRLVDDFGPSV